MYYFSEALFPYQHVISIIYIPVRGQIKEIARAYIQLNPSALGFNWIYTRRQWLCDAKENIPISSLKIVTTLLQVYCTTSF